MCSLPVWKGRVSAIIPRATDPVFVAWVRTPAIFHRDCLELLLFLVLQAYTSAEVSRCCARHCFLALCPMVSRQRRQVSLTLTDRSAKTCGGISSVRHLSSCLLSRARHTSAVSHWHRSRHTCRDWCKGLLFGALRSSSSPSRFPVCCTPRAFVP